MLTSVLRPLRAATAWLLTRGATLVVLLPTDAALPGLKVSDYHRFPVREDGSPFFCPGDTAWELFQRLNCEEANHYLANRAEQSFTMIQAVALAGIDGRNSPNSCGLA